MNPKEIESLFHNTRLAFEKSPIKKYAEENSHQWNYSISATRLTEGGNLIIGFNWGAAAHERYGPQEALPNHTFKDLFEKKDLGSFQRLYLPLKQTFPEEDIDNSMQTNFCFFRSKVESEITEGDLALSIPLFLQLISIIKPRRIIGFSKKLQSYCIENNLCSRLETASFPSNKRTLHVAKGFMRQAESQASPIYFLPHPNAKFTSVARNDGWRFCFGSDKKYSK